MEKQSYESVIIAKPGVNSVAMLDWIKSTLAGVCDVEYLYFRDIGVKHLAYSVKGEAEGYYIIINFEMNRDFLEAWEKELKANDWVIKYLNLPTELDALTSAGEDAVQTRCERPENKTKKQPNGLDVLLGKAEYI